MLDRDGIGGNSPPPVEAYALHIEELFSLASGSTASPVTTDEQETALDSLLDDIRKARKDADDQRAVEKRPHDMAASEVQRAWKPLLERCDAATSAIKTALTPYRTAKQAAKDKAAQEAREEADRKARAAQDALREADDLEARFAAEEQLKQASKLTAVANKIDRSATGLRSYQVAEVTDYTALLKHVKATDPDALKTWLDDYARKALPSQLPGVTIRTKKRAA